MLLALLGDSVEIVNGQYPGGSSADSPVPESVAYYLSPWGYGIFALCVFALLVFAVTRLNVDR